MLRKHPKLFEDPRIDYPIYDLNLGFPDYIQKSAQIIANTRQDLQQNADFIIKANTPFELQPTIKPTYGALLIHGLLDSPFIMRDIGHYLQSQGLLVRSIMLPGHGTVPGALLNTNYADWLQAVNYGVSALKADVEKILLVGFSTGADLAICHAAKDQSIAGVAVIAPALRINSPFTFLSSWQRAINWTWERANWFYVSEEFDSVKYQSLTFNAIYQVYQLGLETLKIHFEQLSHCPLFNILSYEDEIICSQTCIDYFQKNLHPLSRTLLYSARPRTFDDKRIIVRSSAYPDQGIINFSHITLPVAPSNPHYGNEGNYKLASRQEKNMRYGAIDKADTFFYGLLRHMGLTQYEYRRLTFNPDFEFLQNQMGEFVKAIFG